jgi:hypothetical protein
MSAFTELHFTRVALESLMGTLHQRPYEPTRWPSRRANEVSESHEGRRPEPGTNP